MRAIILVFTLFLFAGCGSITIQDREVCADLGAVIYQGTVIGAQCAHTLTSANRTVTKTQWDIERIGWMCMNSKDYTSIETEIEQACQLMKCDYQTATALTQALTRMRKLRDLGQWAKTHHKPEVGPKPLVTPAVPNDVVRTHP